MISIYNPQQAPMTLSKANWFFATINILIHSWRTLIWLLYYIKFPPSNEEGQRDINLYHLNDQIIALLLYVFSLYAIRYGTRLPIIRDHIFEYLNIIHAILTAVSFATVHDFLQGDICPEYWRLRHNPSLPYLFGSEDGVEILRGSLTSWSWLAAEPLGSAFGLAAFIITKVKQLFSAPHHVPVHMTIMSYISLILKLGSIFVISGLRGACTSMPPEPNAPARLRCTFNLPDNTVRETTPTTNDLCMESNQFAYTIAGIGGIFYILCVFPDFGKLLFTGGIFCILCAFADFGKLVLREIFDTLIQQL